jgi:Beta-propeller repeat
MSTKARPCTLVMSLTLGLAVTSGFVIEAGSGARAQELDWATSAGGESSDGGGDVATDPRGNSYVTGSFSGTATFGAGETNETVLSDAGSSDLFVAKYARDGSLLWATSAGGSDFASGVGIATDPSGNSYVTGAFLGTAIFGEGEANETVLSSEGSGDVFVAKYARDGILVWATSAGGISGDGGRDIATDARGNIHVTGNFFGPATFGAGEANETVLSDAGFSDVFVAKYTRDGTLLWATSAGGSGGTDTGSGIATDQRGNSYVTGDFRGPATFGAGEANETVLSNAGNFDVFVAKYARDGTLLWATSTGGASEGRGTGIATDARGNSYVTGGFSGTAIFGEGEANETVLSDAGSGDLFVAKYAPDGSLLWATSAGGESLDTGFGIATDQGGNSYVTGDFIGTATFGAGEVNETVLSSPDNFDVFVAKYTRNGALLWATSAGDPAETDGGLEVATDARGNIFVIGDFRGTATFGAGEANETVLSSAGEADLFVAKYRGQRKKRPAHPH